MLCHYCDVVLLGEVLLLFVEVYQFLVQRLIEQFEILQTSLDIVVFPEPILSSADVVQRILDSVVAKRLPCAVLEDSVLHVSRILAHLASTLLKFASGLQALGLLGFSVLHPSVFKGDHLFTHPGRGAFGANHCDGPTRFPQAPFQYPRSRAATLETRQFGTRHLALTQA